MKNRKLLFLLGALIIALALGFALTSCGNKCPKNGGCYNGYTEKDMCDKSGCGARQYLASDMKCDC